MKSNKMSNEIAKVIASLVIALTLFTSIPFQKVNASRFYDMNGHWAEAAVEYLAGRNIISGYPDGSFQPNNTITVQEFLKAVVDAKGYQLPSLQPNEEWLGWATKYVAAAQINNLIKNEDFPSGGDFARPITRYEMARTVARALKDEQYPPVFNDFTAKIKDYSGIPDSLKESVYRTFVKGIIAGYPDGEFKGWQNATRAEAAIMVQHLADRNTRVKTVDVYGANPATDYIEPQNLVRKIIDMELNGKENEVLQYFTKESRERFNIQIGKQYIDGRGLEDNTVGRSLGRDIRKRNIKNNPDLGYEIKCKIQYINENQISVQIQYYYIYSGQLLKGEQYRAKHCMYKVNGLWYVDLQEDVVYGNERFEYNEGI